MALLEEPRVALLEGPQVEPLEELSEEPSEEPSEVLEVGVEHHHHQVLVEVDRNQ